MALAESLKSPQRRINAYRGLVIDVPRWIEAHEYHRIQQARHGLLMHCPGIISGLEVLECQPLASSIVVSPGAALDPEGRLVVVAEPHRLDLPFGSAGIAHIALQYREVPDSPARPSSDDEDQALYTLEVYSISGGREPPAQPYLELARIGISGPGCLISKAADWRVPLSDEIDLRFREESGPRPSAHINIGIVSAGASTEDIPFHATGTLELIRAINSTTRFRARFAGVQDLHEVIEGCDLLVMAGTEAFSLADSSRENLAAYLASGGVLFGEFCRAHGNGSAASEPFLRSFETLAEEMDRELSPVGGGHPLLSACHVFGEVPEGIEGAPMVRAGTGMVYSEGDYGCLWSGGHAESPASREIIRSAFELGVNLGAYAARSTYEHSLQTFSP